MLLRIVRDAIDRDTQYSEIDKVAIVENFIAGPYEDLKMDLPNVASLVQEKMLPLFFPADSTTLLRLSQRLI